ncbi:hypothetical protein BVG16_24205 [Paenibacillus selenitireducens]|uniref:Glycosyl hydrolase family 4 C-terminal domain-containing protein n=1 Tax=Paenibacillus selenitireducens TaxID=1324314 RepID=A0A1T2X2Y5_9BACL|nr:hypothetical protein [Paenibacillus selenitireducens]OPA74234.1 hypothetical protein BVG16_24205 [Paenibacillus selenitireducens]
MKQVKIAMIGAGSFVFSMSLLYDMIVESQLPGSKLVLMDVNLASAERMAKIARIMAAESGVSMSIEATSDLTAALKDADYVTTSVAAGLIKRYDTDREIILKYGIKEPVSECGGVGGLSYTLRSVQLVMDIVREMERVCPNAWLLNVSNPLPRVMTAVARHSSIRGLGFCSVAQGGVDGYLNVSSWLHRHAEELDVVSAGLNHFSWLLSVRDRSTGEDLLAEANEAVRRGAWEWQPRTPGWLEQYGSVPLAGDSHTGEYLPFPDEIKVSEHGGYHGSDEERVERLRRLEEAANGRYPWQEMLENRSWERPGLVIHALATNTSLKQNMLNIPNRGYIRNLPDEIIVEVPANITNGKVEGCVVGDLPEPVRQLCEQVSRVHECSVRAAVTGDMDLVDEAIDIDPAITQKAAAKEAIRELIRVNADVLPLFKH